MDISTRDIPKELKNKIPTEFTLFASKYSVTVDNVKCADLEAAACFGDSYKAIKLQTVNNALEPNHPDYILESYYHELAHCLIKNAGHDDWKDEKFIDLLGKLLMQYESTKVHGVAI